MKTRILIVEDDTNLKTALIRSLRNSNEDIQVDWVCTAEEAWKFIAELKTKSGFQYNLIIMDVFLAGRLTGLQLWQKC